MTTSTEDPAERLSHQIEAAKVEIKTHQEQLAAEYAERLRQLTEIDEAVRGGTLPRAQALARLHQVVPAARPSASRPTRAGRTHIGLRVPAATPMGSSSSSSTSRVCTPAVANAALTKCLGLVDSAIVGVLERGGEDAGRREARLELALLRSTRRSLHAHAANVPSDAVLIESLLEFADEVHTAVADLAAGGVRRARRLIDYAREVAGQLTALGASAEEIKGKLRQARAQLADERANPGPALDVALAAFDKLQQLLVRYAPTSGRSLLDDVLKGP